jgi:hypothetical protein
MSSVRHKFIVVLYLDILLIRSNNANLVNLSALCYGGRLCRTETENNNYQLMMFQ